MEHPFNTFDTFYTKITAEAIQRALKEAAEEETRRIVYLTLKAVGENATDCKIDGVMKYIEENM
jgi:hypothetical protein